MAEDRIADAWGERTPFAAGEPWPVRVDMHLQEDGLAEGDIDRWAQVASVLHSNGDAIDTERLGSHPGGRRFESV